MRILVLIFAFMAFNIAFGRDISGLYDMTIDGNHNYVEVFKKNNKYYAVAFSNKQEIQKGENNKQKVQSDKNSIFVWNLEEKSEGKYKNGKILNLKNGKIYFASAKYDGGEILKVRASEDAAGVAGKTLKWRKLNDSEIKILQDRRVDIEKLILPQ